MNEQAESANGTIARVFYEGEHPDRGHICVILMFITKPYSTELVACTYMRLAASPDSLVVGNRISFKGTDCFYEIQPEKIIALDKVGATFTTYNEAGAICSGG